ncbi:hypothetical protein [Thalassobacillus hwangdonensis]|uniref:Uncharacterized protein n=1 Tax=Thalassobacillus hwangdonensis TaxID=546108 RepID=A0ABW3L4S3_9BACI
MGPDKDNGNVAKRRYPKRKGCGCNQSKKVNVNVKREDVIEELSSHEESSDKLLERIKKFFL